MSRILLHSIVFSPDCVSTAYLYNDIAIKLQDYGHEVIVLTTTPHYNILPDEVEKQPLKSKLWGLYYTSSFNGILVLHIPQKKFINPIFRMIGFIYWHFLSFILGLLIKNIDLIISPSPPITIGIINILLGKIKGSKTIYNVQEIYPDLLIENYNLKSKLIIKILKGIEKFVYNNTDKVVTIDDLFFAKIIDRFHNKSKLSIIPNFVDTSIYKPQRKSEINIDSILFPDNSALKIMYAGNIGHAQDWDILLKVAVNLEDDNVEFYIVGEGVMKEPLKTEIKKLKIKNIHLCPYQKRENMPDLISYSDLHFIFMSPHTDEHGFPSKVYTVMACAKPMIICSGKNSPITNFLKDKNCSILIEERNETKKIEQLIQAIKTITNKDLIQMGNNGWEIIQNNYSKEKITLEYLKIINSLIS